MQVVTGNSLPKRFDTKLKGQQWDISVEKQPCLYFPGVRDDEQQWRQYSVKDDAWFVGCSRAGLNQSINQSSVISILLETMYVCIV